MLGTEFTELAYLPMSDTQGGILITARGTLVTISDPHIGVFSVTMLIRHVDGDICWWFTSVYGPQADGDKALFLEELEAIQDVCNGPWAVVGDFNLILQEADKNNTRINRRNMPFFRRTVDMLDLRYMQLHGRLFTWSNERSNPTLVKLDRFLASSDWEDLFPFCHLKALSSDISDHCPILMLSNVGIKSKSRFHFEVFWPKFTDYLEVVERGWQCLDDIIDPFRRLDCPLRNSARELQSWAAQKIGNVKEQLLMAKEVGYQLDRAQERRVLSDDEMDIRRNLKGMCLRLATLERIIARQRSWITYLREGEANTKFFHLHASFRKRRNRIASLQKDRVQTSNHAEMAEVLLSYYDALLSHEVPRTTRLNFAMIGIQQLDLAALELSFTEKEVWKTIRELPTDKLPGPDGMTGAFYKSAWPVIKDDVMTAINAFYTVDRRQFRCVNGALLTLIPKKEDTAAPQDYRPISLIHSFPKLVSKMLANRLAPRLDDLIKRNQSAFIKGRSILDNYKYVRGL
jgi:hypothetical protein